VEDDGPGRWQTHRSAALGSKFTDEFDPSAVRLALDERNSIDPVLAPSRSDRHRASRRVKRARANRSYGRTGLTTRRARGASAPAEKRIASCGRSATSYKTPGPSSRSTRRKIRFDPILTRVRRFRTRIRASHEARSATRRSSAHLGDFTRGGRARERKACGSPDARRRRRARTRKRFVWTTTNKHD